MSADGESSRCHVWFLSASQSFRPAGDTSLEEAHEKVRSSCFVFVAGACWLLAGYGGPLPRAPGARAPLCLICGLVSRSQEVGSTFADPQTKWKPLSVSGGFLPMRRFESGSLTPGRSRMRHDRLYRRSFILIASFSCCIFLSSIFSLR